MVAMMSMMLLVFERVIVNADDISTRDGVFELELQTNQQMYKAGEPILVSVSVRNDSNETVTIRALPVCVAVSIDITDINRGKLPNDFHGCPARLDASGYRLPPGTSQQLYSIDVAHASRTIWTSLEKLGYSINEPGTYDITATPLFDGFEYANGRLVSRFHAAQVPRSNVVRIQVRKQSTSSSDADETGGCDPVMAQEKSRDHKHYEHETTAAEAMQREAQEREQQRVRELNDLSRRGV